MHEIPLGMPYFYAIWWGPAGKQTNYYVELMMGVLLIGQSEPSGFLGTYMS